MKAPETLTRMSKQGGSPDCSYGEDCGSAKQRSDPWAFMRSGMLKAYGGFHVKWYVQGAWGLGRTELYEL